MKRTGEHYDIGGTYSECGPELWFYFTTTICAGTNHLLNLFVCHRKTGNIEISVPKKYKLSHPMPLIIETEMSTYNFYSANTDEHHYIKTYCFSEKDFEESKTMKISKHFLPIFLKSGIERTLDPDLVQKIKLEHDLGALIQKEEPDFSLISTSGMQYNCHRVVLMAHLKEQLQDPGLQSLSLDVSDEEMDVLLDFMYTGSVRELAKWDRAKLVRLAEKFALVGLRSLACDFLS